MSDDDYEAEKIINDVHATANNILAAQPSDANNLEAVDEWRRDTIAKLRALQNRVQ